MRCKKDMVSGVAQLLWVPLSRRDVATVMLSQEGNAMLLHALITSHPQTSSRCQSGSQTLASFGSLEPILRLPVNCPDQNTFVAAANFDKLSKNHSFIGWRRRRASSDRRAHAFQLRTIPFGICTCIHLYRCGAAVGSSCCWGPQPGACVHGVSLVLDRWIMELS